MTAHQFRPVRALLRGPSVLAKPGSLRLLLWDVVAMIGLTMLGALAVHRGYEGAGTSLVHNPWSLTLAGLGIAWWLMSDSAWLLATKGAIACARRTAASLSQASQHLEDQRKSNRNAPQANKTNKKYRKSIETIEICGNALFLLVWG